VAKKQQRTHSVQQRRSRQALKTPRAMMGSPAPHDGDLAKVPENRAGEWALVVAKAAATLIPFAGGPAAEVLGAILQPQIEKRKTEWLESIARGLDALSKQVDDLTPERLSQSPEFATAFLHASMVALRTHQREKLEAARNVLLNVAAGTAPDDDLQLSLLNLLDALAQWHLRLLRFFDRPRHWTIESYYDPPGSGQLRRWISPNDAIEESFPELVGRQDLYILFIDDLRSHRLIELDANKLDYIPDVPAGPPDPLRQPISSAALTTLLGQQFLDFITSPLQDAGVSDDATPR
jgi:hypothetical protein